MDQIYGYIYLTINHVNGHEYIGQHKWSRCNERLPEGQSTTLQKEFKAAKGFDYFPIDPNYLGSGTALLQAIKKYGKENFSVIDILDIAYSREELDQLEREWIDHYRRTGHVLYNISDGGTGGGPAGVEHPAYGTKRTEEQRRHLSESHKGSKNAMFGKKTSERTKKLLREKLSGSNNPMYGRRGEDNPNFGKTYPSKGRIQSPEEREMRRRAHLEKCPGVRPPDCSGMIVINNGETNKKIRPSEIDKYPGWSRGMLRRNKE